MRDCKKFGFPKIIKHPQNGDVSIQLNHKYNIYTKYDDFQRIKKFFKKYSVIGEVDSYEYVDLGLPSGTLWATKNVGASTKTQRGSYFSWGNIEGHTATYTEGNYSGTIDDYSFIDDNYILTSGYSLSGSIPSSNDAAYQNLDNDWLIPTDTQFQELIDNCTMEIITIDGISGKLFTSNINGKTLFLPNNGYGNGTTLSYPRFTSNYWTSTEDEQNVNKAYSFSVGNSLSSLNYIHPEEKRFGFGIRPVKLIL